MQSRAAASVLPTIVTTAIFSTLLGAASRENAACGLRGCGVKWTGQNRHSEERGR